MKIATKIRILTFIAILSVAAAIIAGGRSEDSIRSTVMQLTSDKGSCSGEQIKAPSGVNYVLTAAHCAGLAVDGSILVHTEDGRQLLRKVLAEDPNSDLLLLEGVPGIDGLDVAGSSRRGQSIRTFTHGLAFPTYRTEGVLIADKEIQFVVGGGPLASAEEEAKCASMAKNSVIAIDTFFGELKLCILTSTEMATTAFIQHGSSGGPVVDSSGALIGVVSAGGDGYGFLVTLRDIKRFVGNY